MFVFPVSQANVVRKARVGSEYKIRVGGGDDSEEYTQLQFFTKKKKKTKLSGFVGISLQLDSNAGEKTHSQSLQTTCK